MKKRNATILLTSLMMFNFSLVACGKEESVKDEKVASIEIVKNSINSSYTLNSKVDYSKLAINTYNAKKELLNTLKASEHKDSITYTTIDTSKIVEEAIFSVTYTLDSTSFQAEMKYKVTDIEYELNDWSANANYTKTISTAGNNKLTDPDSDKFENDFIEKGSYYIGNENAVNLIPTITAINPDNPIDTVTLEEMPSGTTFSLKNDKDENVPLENALEFLDELKTKCLVKFKTNVTGDYRLTLSNPKLENDITYTFHVVSAYNVTGAKDLFALHNGLYGSNYGTSFNEGIKEFKAKYNLPDSNGLVFQNDVTINRDDVPSFYIWNEKEASDSSVVGSLKDWIGYIDYHFTENNQTISIYGNCHRLMLNDDQNDPNAFPLILTDSRTGQRQEANKPISSHASLFYTSYADKVDASTCKIAIQDLEMSGNMGVSNESTIEKGGPMFVKTCTNSSFKNVIASKIYMPVMVNGYHNDGKGGYFAITCDVTDCRFRDLFNAAVYIFGNGALNVEHSEMIKAGGPLLFLNPLPEQLPSYPNPISTLAKTTVNMDKDSVLSNYTEGKGGWFEAYSGATAMAGNIVNIDALFNKQLSTSFIKEDKSSGTAVKKFDFWMVCLPQQSEGLELPVGRGGVNVDVNIGDKKVFSTLDGRDEVFQAAIAYQKEQTPANLQAYLNTLTSTDFGNNLAYASVKNEPTFKIIDSENISHYAAINQTKDGNMFLGDSMYNILSSLKQDVSSLSYMPSDAFKEEGILAATINGDKPDSVNATDPSSYKGVCNYGILLGNYHKLS